MEELKFICRRDIRIKTKVPFMEKCSCKTCDIKFVVQGHLRRHSESVHKALKVGNKEGAEND